MNSFIVLDKNMINNVFNKSILNKNHCEMLGFIYELGLEQNEIENDEDLNVRHRENFPIILSHMKRISCRNNW